MYKLCIKIRGYVMEEEYISVSQLTDYIRNLINSDSRLKQVYVRGEISNYRNYTSSGHRYFSLKDELDVELLAHAERVNPLTNKPRNFSRYVKKLIEEDIKRENNPGKQIVYQEADEPVVKKEKDAYTLEAMGGYL